MANTIVTGDVTWWLSCPTTNRGFSGLGQPGFSNGLYCSATPIAGFPTPLNDLFFDIDGQENFQQQVDYQCLFVVNQTGTGLTMRNPKFWMPTSMNFSSSSTIQLAIDPAGPQQLTQVAPQAQSIANRFTAPNVTQWEFPVPVASSGIIGPDIPANYCQAIWFKRTALNIGQSPVGIPDGFTVFVAFDSDYTPPFVL